MVSEEEVREALREVIDPELGINIIDLGLVYEVEVDDDRVEILMTLTTPGCPFGSIFDEMVRQEVGAVEGVNEVNVELTFEPSWTPEEMTEEARNELGHLPGMEGF
jgi:metal-sulfur cluster biosynthetic enzyme